MNVGKNGERIIIKKVKNDHRNCSLFRHVARETSGETFNPPPNHEIIFLYVDDSKNSFYGTGTAIGAASYCLAAKDDRDWDSGDFITDYYNTLSFLFIKGDYQGRGYGTQLLKYVEDAIKMQHTINRRPVRIESAEKAVSFFEANGYACIEGPLVSACGGSPLFRKLYRMQKRLKLDYGHKSCVHEKQKFSERNTPRYGRTRYREVP